MRLAFTSGSQIQYTLISKNRSFNSNSFNLQVLSLLRELPIDLKQLEDSVEFFSFNFRILSKIGISIYSLHDDFFYLEEIETIFDNYTKYFRSKSIINVFIIDNNCQNHERISKFINSFKLSYFTFPFVADEILAYYNRENHFSDSLHFISLLRRDKVRIDTVISEFYSEKHNFEFNINEEKAFFDLNPFYKSNITETNSLILNQIIGNSWVTQNPEINVLRPEKRVQIVLEQIENIDKFTELMYNNDIAHTINEINPFYQPLILICPYHFPYQRHYKSKKPTQKEKAFWRIFQTEQKFDYDLEIEEKELGFIPKEYIDRIIKNIFKKISILDLIGYLHANLSYSPVLRLRLIGKSINDQLSHTINKTVNIKTIRNLGRKIESELLTDNIKKTLKKKNRQLVVISDLPIEWSFIDNVPLSFTHDICRIPEYNTNSLVNNYIFNQRGKYSIPSNILSKTLVIHCASDTDITMQSMFKEIDAYKSEFGFNSIICNSVESIVYSLKKFNPDFLIFDCHGDSNENELSSYLILDESKKIYLKGEDIISNNIHAPIVFISACNTMPNNGYVKFLSDAFFQAGAYAVTATFLPLSIKDAGTLLIRILSNLKIASQQIIHSNWLEFLSHTLRKTLIFEAVYKKCIKKGIELDEKARLELGKLLTDLMYFNKRRMIFENMTDNLKKILSVLDFDFYNMENEWLYYTTIGRADLIYFENWMKKYTETNLGIKDINELIEK